MTTPFGGGRTPVILDMNQLNRSGGATDPQSVPPNFAPTAATAFLTWFVFVDWSLFTGNVYWSPIWGHDSYSTAAGGKKLVLWDATNSTVLYTFSSNTSSAAGINKNQATSALATTILITKPAGQAKLQLYVMDNTTLFTGFYFWQSYIVVV